MLMQETAALFVPTLRALHHVVSKPSTEAAESSTCTALSASWSGHTNSRSRWYNK